MSGIRIRLRPDGPMVIESPLVTEGPLVTESSVEIVDHLGNPFPLPADKPLVALCRCGHSAKKPFCDGSHKTCGFQAHETAPQPPSG